MACAIEHAQFNFAAVACACAAVRDREGHRAYAMPFAMGAAAACLPSLPDILEPALHPNHRKFFHSVTVFAALGYGIACTNGKPKTTGSDWREWSAWSRAPPTLLTSPGMPSRPSHFR